MTPTLNRRLVLEARHGESDGAGGIVSTWIALGTLWAQIIPHRGRLVTGETGALSVGRFRIILRGAPQGQSNRPLPGQRFRMASRVLQIDAVTEVEPAGRYLICQCHEQVAP